MVFRTAEELKQAYAQSLREQGKGVSLDVPVGEHGITIDILTDSEMIVCRPELTEKTATEVKSQLTFYGQFGPRWQKVVVVEHVTRPYEVERLAAANIRVVALPQSRTTAIVRVPKKVEPSFQYGATDDYLSFEGGTGSRVAFCAVILIFILGMIGVIASRQQQQPSPTVLQSSLNSL
ncbi:MAG: hypothetical protein AAFV90_14285 [Cyanobacteria bacterium J06634_5]